jgi:AcrR family transcriptional regulator
MSSPSIRLSPQKPATTNEINGSKTQAERTAASDRAMLEAAMALILEHGMEGTTLAAIGERAGYSRGLATYRYGSKAGLFQEVSSNIQRHWSQYLTAAVGKKTGIEALSDAASAFHEFVNQFPQEIRVLHILYYGGASPNSDVRGLAKQAFARQVSDAERWIEQGIDNGSIRDDVDPRSVAAQYVAHIAGLTYIWLLNPGDIDFTRIHKDFIRTLRERLAA